MDVSYNQVLNPLRRHIGDLFAPPTSENWKNKAILIHREIECFSHFGFLITAIVRLLKRLKEWLIKPWTVPRDEHREIKRMVVFDAISATGAGFNAMVWADRAKWVTLGRCVPFFTAISITATLFTSVNVLVDATKGLNRSQDYTFTIACQQEALQEQRTGHLLRLAGHVTLIFSSLIGLLSLLAVSTFASAIHVFACGVSTLFLFIETVYRFHLRVPGVIQKKSLRLIESSK